MPLENADAPWPSLTFKQTEDRRAVIGGIFFPIAPFGPPMLVAGRDPMPLRGPQQVPAANVGVRYVPPAMPVAAIPVGTASGGAAHAAAAPTRTLGGGNDWAALPLKGVLIGLTAFVLWYGFAVNWRYWAMDWHWAWLAAAAVLLTALINYERTTVVLLLIAAWACRDVALAQPLLVARFALGGLLLRFIYQFLP